MCAAQGQTGSRAAPLRRGIVSIGAHSVVRNDRLTPMKPLHLLLFLLLAALTLPAQGAPLRLRLLQTTDVHMQLLNHDYYRDRGGAPYGLALTIPLIEDARREQPNTLLFDNGDLLQGSPLGDTAVRQPGQPHPAYRLLGVLRYDAANLGNHEFNFGLPFLQQATRSAPLPVLSANVVHAGSERPVFTPWVMLQRRFVDEAGRPQQLRIGVLGLLPPQIMAWDRRHLAGKVEALDMRAVARERVPELRRRGADLVVVIAHTGLDAGTTSSENVAQALAQIPGVDALLLGHAHGEFPGPQFANWPGVEAGRGLIHGVPAVMPGRWGDHLGVIDLTLTRDATGRWRVRDREVSLRRAHSERVSPLPALLLAQAHADTVAHMRTAVAETRLPLQTWFSQVQDTLAVAIVQRAQRWALHQALRGTPHEGLPLLSATAPFRSGARAGGGGYTVVPAGPLTMQHVADLYVYPNTLKAVRLNGAELREWLEMAAGQFRRIDPAGPSVQDLIATDFPSFNFDSIEGLDYRIDVTQPARYDRNGQRVAPQAQRIRDLRWRGQPLRDEQVFIVAVNNYRADGGGQFPGLSPDKVVLDTGRDHRELLADYLRAQKVISEPASGHWQLLPVPGVALRFRSAAAARPQAMAPVHWVADEADGMASYEIR